MNLRIIHSDFELNLVDTSFTMIEENNWFGDRMFSKYTYPIVKTLTDDEITALNFLTEHFSRGAQSVFDVFFVVLDQEHEAVMEIDKIVGRKIEFQVRYGFEDFPNFEKKLAQLPLHQFELTGENIYQHAKNRLNQTYPTTDYNFPRIFTDKFDTENPQWEAFAGSINNYTGTVFLQNEYDAIEDKQLNRNVMQPMPHLLYLLKAGFGERGYALEGDILTDPDFKDAYLYSLGDYYVTIRDGGKQEMLVKCDENYSNDPDFPDLGYYVKEIIIAEPGRYKIAGNLFLRALGAHRAAFGVLTINGQEIFGATTLSTHRFLSVNEIFEVLPGQSNLILRFFSFNRIYDVVGEARVYDATILDVTITQLTKYRPDGSAEPTLVLPNDIDLTKCVPDITFGDLYKIVKNWKNYGIDISDRTVYMNLVKNQVGQGEIKDLRHKEIMEPERTSNQGKSFELKFTEISSEDYEFPSMFIDRDGNIPHPYTTKEDTEEMIIDAIPLPRKTESGINTAHGFLDDKNKVQVVLYSGLQSGLNTTLDPMPLMIPAIYENYYSEWIDFLLKAMGYLWTFNDFDINVADIHAKRTIFAYGQYHVIVQVAKKNLGNDIIETELETLTIE